MIGNTGPHTPQRIPRIWQHTQSVWSIREIEQICLSWLCFEISLLKLCWCSQLSAQFGVKESGRFLDIFSKIGPTYHRLIDMVLFYICLSSEIFSWSGWSNYQADMDTLIYRNSPQSTQHCFYSIDLQSKLIINLLWLQDGAWIRNDAYKLQQKYDQCLNINSRS